MTTWARNATNTDDVVETFLCSSMVLPSSMLAQTLPLLLRMRWSEASGRLPHMALTVVEMAGWAGPVIAIFASPNIEASWLIAVVCYLLMLASMRMVLSVATPSNVMHLHAEPWSVKHRSVSLVSVTYVRISSLLFTALGIFCVDYPNFGERFMKTETFGLTLMDIGIGCSLFSSGMSEGLRKHRRSAGYRLLWHCTPLLIIGLFRTAILQSIGYRVEVTEYGRHWNAFLTFAAMPLLLLVLEHVSPRQADNMSALLAILAIVGPYHCLLVESAPYLMDDEQRHTILEANKEGLASLLGFFAVFLGGKLYAATQLASGQSRSRLSTSLLMPLGLCALAVAIDMQPAIVPAVFAQPFSRRICNAPYVLFCVGMNAFFVRCLCELNRLVLPRIWALQRSTKGAAGRSLSNVGIYTAKVNSNQLLYFVLANIITGLMNLAVDTHSLTDFASYFVQAGYVAGLGCVILLVPSIRR